MGNRNDAPIHGEGSRIEGEDNARATNGQTDQDHARHGQKRLQRVQRGLRTEGPEGDSREGGGRFQRKRLGGVPRPHGGALARQHPRVRARALQTRRSRSHRTLQRQAGGTAERNVRKARRKIGGDAERVDAAEIQTDRKVVTP